MKIEIQGARENNLKNIDVVFQGGLTVVTGVSGSGKTSLVFDTLHQEAQRRFQEVFTLGASRERVAPADVDRISGLLPTVAVGQNLLNRNPHSTVATASGLHPLLRLLFARFGVRHCPVCDVVVRILDDDTLIDEMQRIERPFAVTVPLVRYAKGSHAALLALLVDAFGVENIEVDGVSWKQQPLTPDQVHSISIKLADLNSNPPAGQLRPLLDQAAALGCISISIEMDSSERTYSRAPVCSNCGTWLSPLEPHHFNKACSDCKGEGCQRCQGTGLFPNAAATRWRELRFDHFLGQTVSGVKKQFDRSPLSPKAERLMSEIQTRLDALVQVGLGYVTLDRRAPTLSRGEGQRLRLAVLLTGRLSDLLHLIDEPTIGQHPHDVDNLMESLANLSGPVIFVEHDRIAAARADSALDIGPGAGIEGGRVIFSGTPEELWEADNVTGRFFNGRESCVLPEKRPPPETFLTIKGAHLHNLQNLDVPLALNRLNVICGVSGSGKSTLVEDVLFATLTNAAPVGCRAVEGAGIKSVIVDQSPIGRNPRSNPATYTKLLDIIRECFATNTGLDATCFSFNTSAGACQRCNGMGAVEIKMRYLPSTWIPCADCEGARFNEKILDAKVVFGDGKARSIADFLTLTVSEALPLMSSVPGLSENARENAGVLLRALEDIGLGYLTLGQPSPTLSGGEAQRVKLAKYLGRRNLKDRLLILDEPSTGLHPADIHGLLVVMDRLVRSGATIIVVEHNTDIIRAADWLVELGPGAGPEGGRLLFTGFPKELDRGRLTPTSQALAEEADLAVQPLRDGGEKADSAVICIRGARSNNLKNIDIDFPKHALSVVTGISGSGKSSLVGDVIELEARRRYLESLAMYERQSTREGQEAEVDRVDGLGVTLSIGTQRAPYNQRAHLGDDTGIIQGLTVLFAQGSRLNCPDCGVVMQRESEQIRCLKCGRTYPIPKPRHFSPSTYSAACRKCHGVGTLQDPRPEKLIIHPEKPLCDGAMYSPGFFPKGYLCKPFNGGYDMVQAFAGRYGFDPAATPWNEMTSETQHAFLFGDPEPMLVTYTSRNGNVTTREETFVGFYGWIRDWDQGGTYTETVSCSQCAGTGLREPYRSCRLAGRTIHEWRNIPLCFLIGLMGDLPDSLSEDALTAPILNKIQGRLLYLCEVGLGYLHLDRYSATLSAGEAQRVKLAGLLGGRLSGLTLLFDEPTRGLHPREVEGLRVALRKLQQEGNTVIVLEHDLQIIEGADFVVDMGPEAGWFGGEVVAKGSPAEIKKAETYTGRWLAGKNEVPLPEKRRTPERWLRLFRPSGYNLSIDVLALPLGVLVGVCGVSGSGKSTLINDTLGRILAPPKQTTSVAYEPVAPEPYERLEGAPARTLVVDQTRAGLHNPASFLGIEKALRTVFAESEIAAALGLDESVLKRNCSACKGSGVQRIEMGFLPDVYEPCEVCGGGGYPPEADSVRLFDRSLPEVMRLPIEQVYHLFRDKEGVSEKITSAMQVGLGYLILNQPGRTLSGGEAQRLKIAEELNQRNQKDTLYILDEPTIGQHLEDINRLIFVLRNLVEAGQSVLVVEHHPHVLAACDWLVELGPGGGPDGGRIIAAGTPEEVMRMDTPTALYLRQILEGGS